VIIWRVGINELKWNKKGGSKKKKWPLELSPPRLHGTMEAREKKALALSGYSAMVGALGLLGRN
jgi:hypothetical protein